LVLGEVVEVQPSVHLSLYASVVVDVVVVAVAVAVGLGLYGPSSHHDISGCHSVVEVLRPPDHVTTGD
jgi:hypothetical protein